MSNHMIGYAYDEMNEEILKLYDKGEISKEICKKIMRLGVDMVLINDGNLYEATESMQGVRCGECLKPYNGGKIYSIFENLILEVLRENYPETIELYHDCHKYFLSGELCEDCMRKLLSKFLSSEKTEEALELLDNLDD